MKVPEILYKYTTADTAKIVLESGRLRWQSPCQFNDVGELQWMPMLSPDFEESRPIYLKQLVDIAYSDLNVDLSIYSQWTQEIIGSLKKLKLQGVSPESALRKIESVAPQGTQSLESTFRKSTELNNDGSLRCFCLTENDYNELMWAHYGDSYKGCMLGFQHVNELSTPFAAAEKVLYTDEVPVIGSAVDFYLYGPSSKQNKDTRLAIYYTKAKVWEYEKEWRVIYKVSPIKGALFTDYKFYAQELESITFGLRISQEARDSILDLISSQYPHCKIYYLRRAGGVIQRVKYEG